MAWAAKWNGGGTGYFTEVMIALEQPNGSMKGINTIRLGDRVKIENLRFYQGAILSNYLDHAPGQGYALDPTERYTKTITFR